jgi:thiamine-phosphate pyrophosphorylase
VTTPASVPRLHVLTPARQRADDLDTVDAILGAGAPAIQVRVKDATDRVHLLAAGAIADRCHRAGAMCIVNDRADIALAVGADGVHLGAHDLPVEAVRRLAGDRLMIGGTARDPETARRLVEEGADYLGVGPIHATSTKDGLPDPLGLERLQAVCRAVEVPVLAISGITAERTPEVLQAGAAGVAVMSAVMSAPDPATATRALLAHLQEAAR